MFFKIFCSALALYWALLSSSFAASGYYELLGLTINASDNDIRKAWKKIVADNHPDKFNTASAEVYHEKTKAFKVYAEAFEVLSNPEKKRKYDQFNQFHTQTYEDSWSRNYEEFSGGRKEGASKEERLRDIEERIKAGILKDDRHNFWKIVDDFFSRHVNQKITRVSLTGADYIRLHRILTNLQSFKDLTSGADAYLYELEDYAEKYTALLPKLGAQSADCTKVLTFKETKAHDF